MSKHYVGIFVPCAAKAADTKCPTGWETLVTKNPLLPASPICSCRLGPEVRRHMAKKGKPAMVKLRRRTGLAPGVTIRPIKV